MIKGKLITLRLMREDDIEVFVKLTNDTSQTGAHFPYVVRTISATKKIFYDNGFFAPEGGRLLIVSHEDEILGAISYFKNAHYVNGYEIGYQLFREEHRRKGYVTEALTLFSAFLFDYFPISRLQICMEKDNVGSEAVAKKCGFTYEGLMRNAWSVSGKTISNLVYSMIRSEAPKLKNVIG